MKGEARRTGRRGWWAQPPSGPSPLCAQMPRGQPAPPRRPKWAPWVGKPPSPEPHGPSRGWGGSAGRPRGVKTAEEAAPSSLSLRPRRSHPAPAAPEPLPGVQGAGPPRTSGNENPGQAAGRAGRPVPSSLSLAFRGGRCTHLRSCRPSERRERRREPGPPSAGGTSASGATKKGRAYLFVQRRLHLAASLISGCGLR